MSAMPHAELARLSKLIDLIYEGATTPSCWAIDIPSAVAAFMKAPICVFFCPGRMPQDGGFATTYGIPQKQVDLYTTRYYLEDIQAKAAFDKGLVHEGSVILCSDLVPREQLIQSNYYKEYLSVCDQAYSISAMIFGVNSASGVSPLVCSIWRHSNDNPYSEYDREQLNLLVPHLSRSLGVMHRLREADLKVAVSLDALNKLSVGVLLIGQTGMVDFANQSAQRILEEEDGVALRHRMGNADSGELMVDDALTRHAVRAAIQNAISPDILATAHFGRNISVPRPSGRAPYSLNFSSLPSQNEFGTNTEVPRAIVFITDSAAPVCVDTELLKTTYGLTPAEVRVAVTFTEGCSIDEASSKLGVSVNTLKSQLKEVYDKTHTGNRAKLVKLVLSLSANRG